MRISDVISIAGQLYHAVNNRVRGLPIGMRRVGNLDLSSGKLVICDGMDDLEGDCISVPAGKYAVWTEYDKADCKNSLFNKVVNRVVVTNGRVDAGFHEEVVGKVCVDSAKVLLADREDVDKYWEEEGPLRVGEIRSSGDRPTPAELVCKEFGLQVGAVDWFGTARIEGDVSKELEEQITKYLKSFPQFERNTFFYFSVFTGSSFDRFNYCGRRFGILPIDSNRSAYMAMAETGFGDGVYPISIRAGESSYCSVEVNFRGTCAEQFVKHFAD